MFNPERLIIFGGTFDPIHNGHLKIAQTIAQQFRGSITFMPTTTPNYKSLPEASNKARLEMLELAIDNNPNYCISRFEIEQNYYSPSYKTLTSFRNKLGQGVPIYYIIGADSLITLDSWDSWLDLFHLTNFIVLNRPGYSYDGMNPVLKEIFKQRKTFNCSDLDIAYGKIYLPDFELLDISSTQIRSWIKKGQGVDAYLPDSVTRYIAKHKIYALESETL